MNCNTLYLLGLNDKTLDFGASLNSMNSIVIKNCIDLIITVDSTINRIILVRCRRIYLAINKLIGGIEMEYSQYIVLKGHDIPHIDIYQSILFLYGEIDWYRDILVTNDRSEIHCIKEDGG